MLLEKKWIFEITFYSIPVTFLLLYVSLHDRVVATAHFYCYFIVRISQNVLYYFYFSTILKSLQTAATK